MSNQKSFSIWYSYSINRTVAGMDTSITISGEGSYGYMHIDSPELGIQEPQAMIVGAASEIRKEVLEELSVAGIIVSMDEISINIKNMSPIG